MKKSFIMLIVVLTTMTCVFAAQPTKFSKKFIKKIQNCDTYTETIESVFEGQTFTTTRKIIGWRNGMCKYQAVISSKDGEYQLDCNFTEMELEDLYFAMKSKSKEIEKYALNLFAPKINEKTGEITYINAGNTSIKGTKAEIEWAKYENNPYFCKPTKLK